VVPILRGGQRQLQPVCDILQETHDPFALQNPSDRGGMGGRDVAGGQNGPGMARGWIATLPPMFSLSWINLPR